MDALAEALNVSLIELMSGNIVTNKNLAANMKKGIWYVCPACGNVIHAMGEAVISCCGITLPKLEEEDDDSNHEIKVERVEDEYVVAVNHAMNKNHFIFFMAYITENKIQVEKLYPESDALCRFKIMGHGKIYVYCNHHGLFARTV